MSFFMGILIGAFVGAILMLRLCKVAVKGMANSMAVP